MSDLTFTQQQSLTRRQLADVQRLVGVLTSLREVTVSSLSLFDLDGNALGFYLEQTNTGDWTLTFKCDDTDETTEDEPVTP